MVTFQRVLICSSKTQTCGFIKQSLGTGIRNCLKRFSVYQKKILFRRLEFDP